MPFTIPQFTYGTPRLVNVENIERYIPGGFHSIRIGDSFMDGRYKVLHKLGAGGASTVWLARDRNRQPLAGGLVTLKVLQADISATLPDQLQDLVIPYLLHTQSTHHPGLRSIQTVLNHFLVDGPNGSHRIIVHPFAALSVTRMSTLLDRWRGSRRLQADLARNVAKQVAMAVQCMHNAGIVHGDITTSNILFRASKDVQQWSDADIYQRFGKPVEEEIYRWDNGPLGPEAPPVVIEFIDDTRLQDPGIIRPEIVLSDFDRSYQLRNIPENYEPGTVVHYFPPELHFEEQFGIEADIWCLGCAIFQSRAGFPLFSDFWGLMFEQLRMMVETLGRLPDHWWAKYEERDLYFEDDGRIKTEEERAKLAGEAEVTPDASLRDKLCSIGTKDRILRDNPRLPPPVWDQGPMCEKVGVTLSEEEVGLLGDLLEKMLSYRPEDRPTIAQVLEHPWFSYER